MRVTTLRTSRAPLRTKLSQRCVLVLVVCCLLLLCVTSTARARTLASHKRVLLPSDPMQITAVGGSVPLSRNYVLVRTLAASSDEGRIESDGAVSGAGAAVRASSSTTSVVPSSDHPSSRAGMVAESSSSANARTSHSAEKTVTNSSSSSNMNIESSNSDSSSMAPRDDRAKTSSSSSSSVSESSSTEDSASHSSSEARVNGFVSGVSTSASSSSELSQSSDSERSSESSASSSSSLIPSYAESVSSSASASASSSSLGSSESSGSSVLSAIVDSSSSRAVPNGVIGSSSSSSSSSATSEGPSSQSSSSPIVFTGVVTRMLSIVYTSSAAQTPAHIVLAYCTKRGAAATVSQVVDDIEVEGDKGYWQQVTSSSNASARDPYYRSFLLVTSDEAVLNSFAAAGNRGSIQGVMLVENWTDKNTKAGKAWIAGLVIGVATSVAAVMLVVLQIVFKRQHRRHRASVYSDTGLYEDLELSAQANTATAGNANSPSLPIRESHARW
jgi:hypothetical protein